MGQLLSNLNEDEPPRRESGAQRPPAARGGGEAAATTRRRDRRGRIHESCVRGVYAYQQACPLCRDETPLQLTPRRRTDEDVYGVPVDQWEPRHFRVSGTCLKCGESIYAGQHRTREWRNHQYHTFRCPDAETNAVIRALAPEHDWINAPEPPTRN